MDNKFIIRREEEADYQTVEELTRAAFYNQYVPGCDEHYLVHVMRAHPDFLPQLDLVLELEGRVIANVMYTKATLVDGDGLEKEILTFGPLSVRPEYQRKGYGKALLEESFVRAQAMGYDAIVIFGAPGNYVGRGFRCCKSFQVGLGGGTYPTAMLVKELTAGALDGGPWEYRQSSVFEVDAQAAQRFDEGLEPMEKRHLPSQEEFYILSHSTIQ